MNLLYVKIIGGIACVLGIFFAGWHVRDVDYMAYKKEVENAVKAQEANTASIQKQHELVTKGIADEYNAKLSLVRQYYANGVRNNNGSSTMPGLSSTSTIADATAAYTILVGQCAETTLQVVELQKWINAQVGIK